MHRQWAIATLAILASVAAGQTQGTRTLDLPVAQWLAEPDRREFAWKIRVLPPRLTFQQRNLVQVRGTVPAWKLQQAGGGDLHFVVKVADEQGRWLEGESYAHVVLPARLDRKDEIEFAAELFLRSGNYVVATIAYDSRLRAHNVYRKELAVPRLKNDPLPQLDRELPQLEFVQQARREVFDDGAKFRPGPGGVRVRIAGVAAADLNTGSLPLGSGREWLPVPSAQPVRIDVVINFSPPGYYARRAWMQRLNSGMLLQMGSVLSHLELENGCVHVSGLDVLGMKVLFERVEARGLDWEDVSKTVAGINPHVVDVHTLENQKQTARFFRNFIGRVASEPAGCASGPASLEVVIVLGGGTAVPRGAPIERLRLEEPCDCRFYYLRQVNPAFDDISRVLAPVKPRRLSVEDPLRFRKALAAIIREITGARTSAGHAPGR